MAKVRALGMYNSGRNQLTDDLLDEYRQRQRAGAARRAVWPRAAGPAGERVPAKRRKRASQPLLSADPNNAWYLDLATDIDLGQNKSADAIKRLNAASELKTNPVLQLNLANAYLEGGQPAETPPHPEPLHLYPP